MQTRELSVEKLSILAWIDAMRSTDQTKIKPRGLLHRVAYFVLPTRVCRI